MTLSITQLVSLHTRMGLTLSTMSSNLVQLIPRFPLEYDKFSVSSTRRKELSVRRVPHNIDEPLMLLEGPLPLEGRALEVADGAVLAAHDSSEGSRRLEVDRVYGLRVAHDLASARASLGIKNVTELEEKNFFFLFS